MLASVAAEESASPHGDRCAACSLEAPVEARGMRPDELAARCKRGDRGLSAERLERWLVTENYVTVCSGLLVPTEKLRSLFWTNARSGRRHLAFLRQAPAPDQLDPRT